MKPAPFRYARPDGVFEAVGLLHAHGPAAKLLAGGQSLVPLLSRRIETPSLVIDINHIGDLDSIEVLPDSIRMGALVRQERARCSAIIRRDVPGLAAALAWVANPVVRQRGTVIGNLVVNGPGAELPAVALALDAMFVLRYLNGEETVAADALLGPGRRLPVGAMVTHVLWPRRPAQVGFYEVARRDGHAPVVSALVSRTDGDCRVGVSGVTRTGLSCKAVARLIGDAYPHAPSVAQLSAAMTRDIPTELYTDAYSSAQYRVQVAPVVTQRAVRLMAAMPRAA